MKTKTHLLLVTMLGLLLPSGVQAQESAASGQPPAVNKKQTGTASFNLGGFIKAKLKAGLKNKALINAVQEERNRLGLKELDQETLKKVQDFEQKQTRIDNIEHQITRIKVRLGSGNANDSKTRTELQQKIKKLKQEKEQLEKEVSKILSDINACETVK